MNKYSKPIVLMNEELAEGIYAASGSNAPKLATSECWTVASRIDQTPDNGNRRYVIHVDAWHNVGVAANDAHTSNYTLTITFNQAVTYNGVTSSSITISGGTQTTNPNESVGFSAVELFSDDGLKIVDTGIVCNGR